MNLKTQDQTDQNFYKVLFKAKKNPESLREFLYINLKLNYALASAAIKFNAEPATNQPI